MYWCKTRQTYEHTMISITNSTTDYAHQSMFVSLKYIILSLFLVRSRWHHFEAWNVWNTFLLVFRFMRDPLETRGAETCRRGEGCFRYFMQVTLGNTIQRRKPPSKRAWIQLTYGNIPLKMAKQRFQPHAMGLEPLLLPISTVTDTTPGHTTENGRNICSNPCQWDSVSYWRGLERMFLPISRVTDTTSGNETPS